MHNQNVGFEQWQAGNLIKKASYHFDALGRRVEKIVEDYQNPSNNKTRLYTYHDNEILSVYNEDNMRLATYTHSLLRTDDPLSMEVTAEGALAGIAPLAKSYYFFKDGLGSIEAIVDEAGNKIQSYVYSSFGKLLKTFNSAGAETSTPEVEPHFTYTAREIDEESGLYHYRARAFNPELGRFLQVDPHPGLDILPLTYTGVYTYSLNDPMSLTDPSGEFPLYVAIAIGIGALVGYSTSEGSLSGTLEGALKGLIIGVLLTLSPIPTTVALVNGSVQASIRRGNFFENFDKIITTETLSTGAAFFGGIVGEKALEEGPLQFFSRVGAVLSAYLIVKNIKDTACDEELATKAVHRLCSSK